MMEERYAVTSATVRDFMYRVYSWMFVGLATTSAVAYYVATSPALFKTIVQSPLVILLFLIQVGVVLYLSNTVKTTDYSTAAALFMGYAALSGLTFSVYFYIYTMASIYLALGVTALTFLSMALYGYFTDADLTSMGSYLVMGLYGVMATIFINMFLRSPITDYYISLACVAIFTLMTAYDVQKLRQFAMSSEIDERTKKRVAIQGALMLYLDFINLFIHMLRLFGKRKD